MPLKSLTVEDIKHIATQLNVTFNVPFVPEGMEQAWIEWVLTKAMPVVPADVVRFLADASDGLTAEEMEKYEVIITDEVNKLIDLPYVPEVMEAGIIRPVIHQLLVFTGIGKSLSFFAE